MLDYHEQTAYDRLAMKRYSLDWEHQPIPFKRYKNYRPLPLPPAQRPAGSFLDLALPKPGLAGPGRETWPQAAMLSSILELTAGVTQERQDGQSELGLRAPASAGALYPAELYVAAAGLPDCNDGLYHFTVDGPQGPGMHHIWPATLAQTAARMLGFKPRPLVFFITVMFWRSLWKYSSRAWRYCLLDAGHMLANLELALQAWGYSPQYTPNFSDNKTAVFLGLSRPDEACLAAVSAGPDLSESGPAEPGIPPLNREARPLSRRIGRDQLLHKAVALSSAFSPKPPAQGRMPAPPQSAWLLPLPKGGGPDLSTVINQRRSRRDLGSGLYLEDVATWLAAALPEDQLFQATVSVRAMRDLPEGSYLYYPTERVLAPQESYGGLSEELARACLGQMWLARAGICLVFWADLAGLIEQHGERIYREVMLAAGRAGQRFFLAAQALNLAACGVGAFYDEEVARVLNLPLRAKVLYAVAGGRV